MIRQDPHNVDTKASLLTNIIYFAIKEDEMPNPISQPRSTSLSIKNKIVKYRKTTS